jgi:hypothetical protein
MLSNVEKHRGSPSKPTSILGTFLNSHLFFTMNGIPVIRICYSELFLQIFIGE